MVGRLVRKWLGQNDPDPLLTMVQGVLASQQQQSHQQHELMVKMLESQRDQHELTKRMLDQYMTNEPNQSTSLDQRLFKEEEDEWDEVVTNPFEGM